MPGVTAPSIRRSPSRTALCARAARVVASEWPMSTAGPSSARSRSIWAASAAGLRADTTHGTSAGSSTGSGSGTGAASSMTACALVPLMPNEDTPARRGRSSACHGRGSVSSSTAPDSQSTCGEGSSTCNVFGSRPLRMAMTILMIPPTPAAAWVWPMLDLSEPSHSGSPARS